MLLTTFFEKKPQKLYVLDKIYFIFTNLKKFIAYKLFEKQSHKS